ncbi:N-formylglutamate deformylase [Phaeobacter porticola]|uniref:N-formylglutamate deformylase HutG n=1 Tax=Phaeobacter porticola TaxID=1844006 RepID=A0A1L3I606_9RHOB|nr:N-formylglutamate deformylase [Phaeobacter porticola]APG47594.1 N-formylglutamate deformylase HutG [Phaeobacter porticola]
MATPDLMTFVAGSTPVLLNVPHAGTLLPGEVKSRLREDALELKDTDWHMDQLALPCADLGVSILAADYSRYVVDLNRSAEDMPLYSGPTTGLVSQIDFDGCPLYLEGQEPDTDDTEARIQSYWAPYHQALNAEIQRIKAQFGICVLVDLHSIRSQVPRLFDGVLPDFNLGTNSGASTAARFESCAEKFLQSASYSFVKNGRFKGGYITRHYGRPSQNVHALQLEIAQATYMREYAPWDLVDNKANKLKIAIKGLVSALLHELDTTA